VMRMIGMVADSNASYSRKMNVRRYTYTSLYSAAAASPSKYSLVSPFPIR